MRHLVHIGFVAVIGAIIASVIAAILGVLARRKD